MIHRIQLSYGALAAVWLLLVIWQAVDHQRVNIAAQTALINRAIDISETLGLVIRSQRFRGTVPKDRLEPALQSLVKQEDLRAIELLNDAGEVVASAGSPIPLEVKNMAHTSIQWGKETVAFMNLVDLGPSSNVEGEPTPPTIVVTNRFPLPPPFGTNRPPPDRTRLEGGANSETSSLTSTNRSRFGPRRDWTRFRDRDRRPPFGRPFWMSEEEYKAALQKQGLHSFVLLLSTRSVQAASRQDLWLRGIITTLASVAVLAFGLVWRNQTQSAELQVRLVRAAEMNTRLKEMNIAAAGLAHETRNPLNIIRGLAQIISKTPDATEAIRKRSADIISEVDLITTRLNEFINYSKPLEVRRCPVDLPVVINDMARALKSDLEDKSIQLILQVEDLTLNADQQLFRQVVFNLLLNAIQAVGTQGRIEIAAWKENFRQASVEVRDNGPGVPPEQREEIFRPYFTTREKGTGLGLAVVKQIVLLHGWDIQYVSLDHQGAVFRLSGLDLASSS